METLVKIIFIIFIPFLLFPNCKKESLIANKTYPNVDPELWIYFQRFELAAAKRAIDIDLSNSGIYGTIENINVNMMIGMCYHDSNEPHKIIVDKAFWSRASALRREMIVFHELGHCYLNLEHRDEILQNGRCKSIMRSGDGNCIDMYNYSTRREYQDELFY